MEPVLAAKRASGERECRRSMLASDARTAAKPCWIMPLSYAASVGISPDVPSRPRTFLPAMAAEHHAFCNALTPNQPQYTRCL
jgi:hypothetical protein